MRRREYENLLVRRRRVLKPASNFECRVLIGLIGIAVMLAALFFWALA